MAFIQGSKGKNYNVYKRMVPKEGNKKGDVGGKKFQRHWYDTCCKCCQQGVEGAGREWGQKEG